MILPRHDVAISPMILPGATDFVLAKGGVGF